MKYSYNRTEQGAAWRSTILFLESLVYILPLLAQKFVLPMHDTVNAQSSAMIVIFKEFDTGFPTLL